MSHTLNSGPRNLLAWNQELDRVPPWTRVRIAPPTINNPDPSGGNSSSLLHEDNSLANTHYIQQGYARYLGRQYCFSFFAKAINRSWIRILSAGGNQNAYIDITNGIFGTFTGTPINSGIIQCPSSWYYVFVAFLSSTSGTDNFTIAIAEANNDQTFDGLDQDSLYIWRPCVNYGPYPEDFDKIYTAETPLS